MTTTKRWSRTAALVVVVVLTAWGAARGRRLLDGDTAALERVTTDATDPTLTRVEHE